MRKEISVGNSTLLLEQGEFADDIAVLFLPGISGGALSDRFAPLAQMVTGLGHTSVRMHAWEGDVQTKTLKQLYSEMEASVEYLLHNGFEEIVLIGKSFGGGLVLAYEHPRITGKIMWAPAIGVSEKENISSLLTTQLKEIKNLLDIQMSFEDIQTDDALIAIIHGTTDSVIPLANSEKIIASATGGVLRVIEGADHSFKLPMYEEELLRTTKELLEGLEKH